MVVILTPIVLMVVGIPGCMFFPSIRLDFQFYFPTSFHVTATQHPQFLRRRPAPFFLSPKTPRPAPFQKKHTTVDGRNPAPIDK